MVLSETATRILWREMYYTLTRRAILDWISAAEACFISFEIITIFMFYGKTAFTVFCFCNLLIKSYRTGFYRGTSCPYRLVSDLAFRQVFKSFKCEKRQAQKFEFLM